MGRCIYRASSATCRVAACLALAGCASLSGALERGARGYLDHVDTSIAVACAMVDDQHAKCLGMRPSPRAERVAGEVLALPLDELDELEGEDAREAVRVIRHARMMGADL